MRKETGRNAMTSNFVQVVSEECFINDLNKTILFYIVFQETIKPQVGQQVQ